MKFLSDLLLKIFIFVTITLEIIQSTKEIKNILVYSFPGGKSHSFIFRELFDYTQARMKEENPNVELNFKIIIHNYDMELWENSPYDVIGYGDKLAYEEKFQIALEMVMEDPVFGYNNFLTIAHLFFTVGLISGAGLSVHSSSLFVVFQNSTGQDDLGTYNFTNFHGCGIIHYTAELQFLFLKDGHHMLTVYHPEERVFDIGQCRKRIG